MEAANMNGKYLYVLKILLIIFFICLFENHWHSGSFFYLSCAWGEEDSIISTEKGEKLVEMCSHAQISREQLDQILNVIRQSGNEGFPVEIFLNKALEGAAKRVPVPVIVRVLQERLENFQTCQTILQQMPGIEKEPASQKQQTLTILAESLSRGVSGQELKELCKLTPNQRSSTFANASESLATLKNLGFTSADAREIIKEGLKNGLYRQPDRGMALSIREAKQRGVSNQELKGRILTNIKQGRGGTQFGGGIQFDRPNNEHIRKQFQGR